jgi:hypothetical protein
LASRRRDCDAFRPHSALSIPSLSTFAELGQRNASHR